MAGCELLLATRMRPAMTALSLCRTLARADLAFAAKKKKKKVQPRVLLPRETSLGKGGCLLTVTLLETGPGFLEARRVGPLYLFPVRSQRAFQQDLLFVCSGGPAAAVILLLVELEGLEEGHAVVVRLEEGRDVMPETHRFFGQDCMRAGGQRDKARSRGRGRSNKLMMSLRWGL